MRKSFTRVSSILVLLFLSFQMVWATPTLVTNGLSPSDGGELDPDDPVFTMTFTDEVEPGMGQIIGLYSNSTTESENRAIQLRAADTTDADGVITFTHADGTVVFDGKTVTIKFPDYTWEYGVKYWITIGVSAIQDADGAMSLTDAFGDDEKWSFTLKDVVAPVPTLYPADDATEVSTSAVNGHASCAIKFDEQVMFVDTTDNGTYEMTFGDFALYTSTDTTDNVNVQEGGDLLSLDEVVVEFFNTTNGSTPHEQKVNPSVERGVTFDSISIGWGINYYPSNSSFYVRVKSNMIADLSGNLFSGFNNNTDWNFTTKDDDFDAPTITSEHTPLWSDDEFYIVFKDETLYNTDGTLVETGDDFTSSVTVTDANDDTLTVSSAKIDVSTNTITVILSAVLNEEDGPFTVAFDADVFLDASGNSSKTTSEEFDAGNWNAPDTVSARVTNQGGTTMDFLVSASEACAVHYIVVGDGVTAPTKAQVFGYKGSGSDATSSGSTYYRVDASTAGKTAEGEYGYYYGTSSNPIEIFAEGNISIPTDSFEVLKRITGLPATDGSDYEIYFVLIDTVSTAGKYDSDWWLKEDGEHLSSVLNLTEDVYTTDILMPTVWFDGDPASSSSLTSLNAGEETPTEHNVGASDGSGLLSPLARDGKIYINFNEPIRKSNGNEFSSDADTQDDELHSCLFVYEYIYTYGSSTSLFDPDTDSGWSTNYGYTASLSDDKQQIIIEPDSSWASYQFVLAKIRNSVIEDEAGNEIVPYDTLYADAYRVEDYIPPLVRYTFRTTSGEPMDSMINVPYQDYENGAYSVNSIIVTISEPIYVFPESGLVTNDDPLMEFTSDPADDQYIGNFFKIRAGTSEKVNVGMGDALEDHFTFDIDYTYDDSTKITITPDSTYESETWYLVEIDERIQDGNQQTIAEGAAVDDDSERPDGFKLAEAPTGNPFTETGWSAGNASTDDNQSIVFKSEDSRNPELTFFSKKQSTLLSALKDLSGLSDVAVDDTIGVYIDEYVSLGFDSYVKFDNMTKTYTLDANAMRRYFKVFDYDSTEMDFDVVDLDTSALSNDTLIFYIDPYYVNSDGTATSTEDANFEADKSYTVYFNSEDEDDTGIEDLSGKEKGIYWDDNNNLVLETWATFSTVETVNSSCVTATIYPTPGATALDPDTIDYISIEFKYAATGTLPDMTITNPSGSTFATLTGQLWPGNSDIVYYSLTATPFAGDSTYTVSLNSGITINSGDDDANEWPSEACSSSPSSLSWTYSMIDKTAPELDSSYVAGYTYFTIPADDSVGFPKTSDIVMVFDEEVETVSGKRLIIYNSSNETVATVGAQYCEPGKNGSTTDKHVIVVPNAYFGSELNYDTHYHINVDEGFVTDNTGNKFAGISGEDVTANGTEDGDNDWSFKTGSDPAPYFTAFSPTNGTSAVSDLTVTFSEAVVATNSTTDKIQIYEVLNGGSGTEFLSIDEFKAGNTDKITSSTDKKTWTIKSSNDDMELEYGQQYAIVIPAGAFRDGNSAILAYGTDTTEVEYAVDPVTDSDQSDIDTSATRSTAIWYVNFSDAIAPKVANVWPRNDAEHVPYNAYLYIEFSEPVKLSDGSAIIADPNLLEQTIDSFIVVKAGSATLDPSEYDIEFIDNDKQLLRITPMDTLGYGYQEGLDQPTMQTLTDYEVTVKVTTTTGTYSLADSANNVMTVGKTFDFTTEDIIAPVIEISSVDASDCDNKVEFTVDVTEDDDISYVYYAVLPVSADEPTAAELFSESVTSAVKTGKQKVTGGNTSVNFTVDMGTDYSETPSYILYAVAEDDEIDIWKPASSDWDSLFFIGEYGEGTDRIRDIMPAPNENDTVKSSDSFKIWDDDAPTMTASYPDTTDVTERNEFPVADSIRFDFSEAVVPGNGNGSPDSIYLRRYNNNIAVKARITWLDSSFYINPDTSLEQETKYYVEFDRYAIEDTAGVCEGNSVYYPQMVGKDFWFMTEDNIGPRLVTNKLSPSDGETCVFCPDLNANYDEVLSLTFYDNNPVVVNSSASDPYIYLYRAKESVTTAWDIIPASDIADATQGSTDSTWVVSVSLPHEFYSDDSILVKIPAGLFTDKYDNPYTVNTVDGATTYSYTFETCKTDAPEVTWAIHSIEGYFNYSESDSAGIYGEWTPDYLTGDGGATIDSVPTHVAIKVDFGEDVEFNTSGSTWEALGSSGLTYTEIMNILDISGLTYNSNLSKSDLDVLDTTSSTITIGLRPGNGNCEVYQLLADADTYIANGLSYSDTIYHASLKSNTTYDVTVTEDKVRAVDDCSEDSRYVDSDILSFTTRDDTPPTVAFTNEEGESLCKNDAICIGASDPIVIKFSDPVVKSSYDVSWLGEESYTYDNLPLDEGDLTATSDGKYFEFYPVSRTVSGSTITYTRTGDSIAVNVISLDDTNYQEYKVQPADSLASEGWYALVFNKHTVKKYEADGPNGTVFEGDSCYFHVGDYEAPVVLGSDSLSPNGAGIGSDTDTLMVIFNEEIQRGTTTELTKIRREDGSVFAEFDVSSTDITIDEDTLFFAIDGGLEDYTTYYVEMPEGFITDDNAVCSVNDFAGFAAQLDASTGELIDADWTFTTIDATPPQLVSEVVGTDTVHTEDALFPAVGDTASTTTLLKLTFDENVTIDLHGVVNGGIVIYQDNGDSSSFGNAVEYISWEEMEYYDMYGLEYKMWREGSDEYDGLTSNVIVIDPDTTFEVNSTYYVRVTGDAVKDESGNAWSESTNSDLDPITGKEWWFTIANDVAPVLVETDPAYDGVNAAREYNEPDPADSTDYGFVIADLSMTFEDGNGNALDVAKGTSDKMLRIFEYTYDAEAAEFTSKPWIELPITDESITVSGNVVTVNDVRLRDGIESLGTSLATDSCYYVTVDAGAILNAEEESSSYWEGISNGFRWRFQTPSDDVFVDGYEILSPYGDEAVNLTIDDADSLIVQFNEGIEPLENPTGRVVLSDEDGNSTVITIDQPESCKGNTLYLNIADSLAEEKTYSVLIQEGALGDTSTVSTPNDFAIDSDMDGVAWTFAIGDHTNPAPVAVTPNVDSTCVGSDPLLSMTFSESEGVFANTGSITVTDSADYTLEIPVDSLDIDGNVVSYSLVDLPDEAVIYVNVPAGLLKDGSINENLSDAVAWSFTTGENTAPTVAITQITPGDDIAEADSAELQFEFSEPVDAVDAVVTILGDAVELTAESDSVYTCKVTGLTAVSDSTVEVLFAEGSFVDRAVCSPNELAETTLTFDVADIVPPAATYATSPDEPSDYRDLELIIEFDDEVTAATGNVVIYDETGAEVLTIPVGDFSTDDNVTYTYTTDSLFYGTYYVLIDSASFVDNTAAAVGQTYAGITDSTEWVISIVDDEFENCAVIVSPEDGSTGIETTVDLIMQFDCEYIQPGDSADAYVMVSKQTVGTVGQDYFKFAIADSMISEDGHTLTVPATGLEESTSYSVTIAPGAILDEAGNSWEGIIEAETWNFETGDFTSPEVTVPDTSVISFIGEVPVTSSELGTVYLVNESVAMDDVATITAAIDEGKAVKGTVTEAGVAVELSTADLEAGNYYGVAVDEAGNIGVSTNVVVVTIPDVVTISDIQGTTDDSPYAGEVVTTEGVVTGVDVDGDGFFIQDADGARNGVYVYSSDVAAEVSIGMSVELTASVQEYYGMTELYDIDDYDFVSKVADISAVEISASDLDEDYEGVLVSIDTLRAVSDPDTYGDWKTVDQAGDSVTINDQLYAYVPEVGNDYNIIGVVNYDYSVYKLAPTSLDDVEHITTDVLSLAGAKMNIYPNPFSKYIQIDNTSDLEITKAVITNITGQVVKKVMNPESTISTSDLSSGVYFISLHTADGIAKTEKIIKR